MQASISHIAFRLWYFSTPNFVTFSCHYSIYRDETNCVVTNYCNETALCFTNLLLRENLCTGIGIFLHSYKFIDQIITRKTRPTQVYGDRDLCSGFFSRIGAIIWLWDSDWLQNVTYSDSVLTADSWSKSTEALTPLFWPFSCILKCLKTAFTSSIERLFVTLYC